MIIRTSVQHSSAMTLRLKKTHTLCILTNRFTVTNQTSRRLSTSISKIAEKMTSIVVEVSIDACQILTKSKVIVALVISVNSIESVLAGIVKKVDVSTLLENKTTNATNIVNVIQAFSAPKMELARSKNSLVNNA